MFGPNLLLLVVSAGVGLAAATPAAATPAGPRLTPRAASSVDEPSAAVFAVEEAGVLRSGQFELSAVADNYDRDPLGLDVVDGLLRCRLGFAERFEVSLAYQITRSVSAPGSHPVPSPPLDIIVAGGGLAPGAYRSMYWPMPFLSHKPARVGDMVPGEYTLGLKGRLFRQRGWRPALALGARIAVPGDMSRHELSKGSGSGTLDIGLHSALSWQLGRLDLSANLGATLNGVVEPGDQVLVIGEPSARPLEIRRPHFLHNGIGARWRLRRDLAALAELSGWASLGGHTRMQRECGAADALGGLEVHVRRLRLTLGLRQHLLPETNGLRLPTGPLTGAVDLSDVPEEVRAPLLASLGAENRRVDANVVVLGWPSAMPLPGGARRIPEQYATSTTGNTGFFVRLSLRLGR